MINHGTVWNKKCITMIALSLGVRHTSNNVQWNECKFQEVLNEEISRTKWFNFNLIGICSLVQTCGSNTQTNMHQNSLVVSPQHKSCLEYLAMWNTYTFGRLSVNVLSSSLASKISGMRLGQHFVYGLQNVQPCQRNTVIFCVA